MKKLSEMTLHEKVCQMMVVQTSPEKHRKLYGSVGEFLKKYPVGGIFVGQEIIRDDVFEASDMKAIIDEYQQGSDIPLVVAADCEAGAGCAVQGLTRLPGTMALGACDSEELAYEYGKRTAVDSRMVGINWSFSPVADLMMNPFAGLIGGRIISDDINKALPVLKNIVRGMQDNGMAATAKHFPGDGLDYRNQHIVTSTNSLSEEDWFKHSGRAFQELIDMEVDSIMIGHINLPVLQNDDVDGEYPPATLSYDLMTKLLKDRMGFKGVAVTDALDMGGVVRWYGDRRANEVQCIIDGIDMLLWPRIETIDMIEKAVEDGVIPLSRIDDAVTRVLRMKEHIESFGFASTGIDKDSLAQGEKLAETIANGAPFMHRNKLGLIPLDKNKVKKVRLIEVHNEFEHDKLADYVKAAFEKRGAEVDLRIEWNNYLSDYETDVDRDYDIIVYANFAVSALPMKLNNIVRLHSAQAFDRDKTVVMTVGTPHYLTEFYPTAETAIHTYQDARSIESAVAALYGEQPFTGRPMVNFEKHVAQRCVFNDFE